MKIFSPNKIALINNIIKAIHTEGVYADTPQNRKLGRVGLSYKKNVKGLPEEERNEYRFVYEDNEKNRKLKRVGLSPWEYRKKKGEKENKKVNKKYNSIKSEELIIDWKEYPNLSSSFINSLSEEQKIILQDKLLVATKKFKIPKNIITVFLNKDSSFKFMFHKNLISSKISKEEKFKLQENIRQFLRQQRQEN